MSYTTALYSKLPHPDSVPLTVDTINRLSISCFAQIQALDARRNEQKELDATRLESVQPELDALRKRLAEQKTVVLYRTRWKSGGGPKIASTKLIQPLPPLPPIPKSPEPAKSVAEIKVEIAASNDIEHWSGRLEDLEMKGI